MISDDFYLILPPKLRTVPGSGRISQNKTSPDCRMWSSQLRCNSKQKKNVLQVLPWCAIGQIPHLFHQFSSLLSARQRLVCCRPSLAAHPVTHPACPWRKRDSPRLLLSLSFVSFSYLSFKSLWSALRSFPKRSQGAAFSDTSPLETEKGSHGSSQTNCSVPPSLGSCVN